MNGYQVTDDRYYYTSGPSTAVIPVSGVMVKDPNFIQESCLGFQSIDRISMALRQAVAAPEIETIVLDVTSPGGQVTGINELASNVKAATKQKTVYAFTDGMMASAAYWISSQADEIYATPSATVGSIGTYLALLDETVKMQMEGVKLEMFSAGKYKGMGTPGKPLNNDDRAYLQNTVNQVNGWFTSAVSKARPNIPADAMEGQGFFGAQAEKKNLVDGLVNDWDEFTELIGDDDEED